MAWIVAVWVSFAELCAQTAERLPAFEVVSIRPSGANSRTRGIYTFPGGRVTGENRTLSDLIEEAFDLQRFQVLGGEKWVHEDRYDFDARPPKSSKSSQANPSSIKLPPNEEQRGMLRAMLLDRFQLKYHMETREGPVYFLEKSGKELKLAPSKNPAEFPWVGFRGEEAKSTIGLGGENAPMPLMAKRLSTLLARIVVDRTRLEGSFDFGYQYVADDPKGERIHAIFVSVEAIGLKLESGKGPIRYLVIDSASKPSEN